MVEVVQVSPCPGSGIQLPHGFIGRIEPGPKAPKQPGHSEIRFAIAVIHSRVEYHRLTTLSGEAVPTPEVTMKHRRHRSISGKECRHAIQQLSAALLQAIAETVARRKIQLVSQASIAEERHPIVTPFVQLGSATDRVVTAPAESCLRRAMLLRELLTEDGVSRTRWRAAFNPFEGQPGVANTGAKASTGARVIANTRAKASTGARVIANAGAKASTGARVIANAGAKASTGARVIANIGAKASTGARVIANTSAKASTGARVIANAGVKANTRPSVCARASAHIGADTQHTWSPNDSIR